jgi:bifunctional DNase/RNase
VSKRPEQYQDLRIKGLSLPDPENDPKLHLETAESGFPFSMEIGPFEASAILIELEGLIPPRPLTHDLLAQTFRTHGFKPQGMYLYRKIEDQFLAKLYYKKGWTQHEIELRPSDGFALSLRLGFPVKIEKGILDHIRDSREEEDYAPPSDQFIPNQRESFILRE